MTFSGFPEQALDFYDGLEADNTKAYWTDHKAVYEECVAAPMKELLTELEKPFGPWKMFRPYRDVRFSKDKTPYKTRQYAVLETGLYIGIDAAGLHLGGGRFHLEPAEVARLRVAVADDLSGSKLVKLLKALESKGFTVGGEQLKRIPKPWDDTHPRADLLRHKALVAWVDHPPAEWFHEVAAKDHVIKAWKAIAPLNHWLKTHVGDT